MSQPEQQRQIVPAETYSEAKGQLWGQYMASITPKLKSFQEVTRNECLAAREAKKSSQIKHLQTVDIAEQEYVRFCITEFTGYIESLQLSYIRQALRDNGIDQRIWHQATLMNLQKKKIQKKKAKKTKKHAKPKKVEHD